MTNAKSLTLKNIKVGEAFQTRQNGPVYVKCRGGFRLGCGGELQSCDPKMQVIKYNC